MRNGKAIKVVLNEHGKYVPLKNVHKINKQLSLMKKSANKTAAKKVSAKKTEAPKKVAEKKEVKITRANFPEKGWGFTPEQHDQIAKIGIANGFRNLSQVIRAAMTKAYGVK